MSIEEFDFNKFSESVFVILGVIVLFLIVCGVLFQIFSTWWKGILQTVLLLLMILHPLLWYFLYTLWFKEYHADPFVISGIFSFIATVGCLVILAKSD